MLLLCIVGAVGLTIWMASNQTRSESQQEDVEALRDQLKTYQTETVPDTLPEEPSVEAETEEPVIPETEEPSLPEPEIQEPETIAPAAEPEESEIPAAPETDALLPETEPKPEPEVEKIPEATLDFASMWETNPDICAWIEIDGTKVDYPVLQSAEDDNKYLSTAVDGTYYIGGSLFTQATYNSRDFDDPVTIIYGHTMRSGTLFGQLQPTYSSAEGFAEHSEIKLYLPDEVRYYTVFAAVPYESIHILDTYDFTNNYWYRNFFKGVRKIRRFGANFNHDIAPEPGDRVLILSTCLNEDSTKRYLVMAMNQDDME